MTGPRVCISPVQGPVGDIRLGLPATAVAALGHEVSSDPGAPRVRLGPVTRWGTPGPVVEAVAPDCDVLVVQRPTHRGMVEAIPLLQAQGIRVVVEVDDDYDTIPADNPASRNLDGPVYDRAHLGECSAQADHVVVSTPTLADRYGTHGRVSVVANGVPSAYLGVEHSDRPILGWTGEASKRPSDLAAVRGLLQTALDRAGWQFAIVGPPERARHLLGLDVEPECTGYVDLDTYAQRYARLGVAVVPLADNDFNRSKSALKMLQAAALGVPVVASATSDNLRLNRLGIGLIARDRDEWAKHLRDLMGSADLRAELSARGREVARTQTYEAKAEEWWDAWTAPLRAGVSA